MKNIIIELFNKYVFVCVYEFGTCFYFKIKQIMCVKMSVDHIQINTAFVDI